MGCQRAHKRTHPAAQLIRSSGPVRLVGEVQAWNASIRESANLVRRIPDVASVSAHDKEDGAVDIRLHRTAGARVDNIRHWKRDRAGWLAVVAIGQRLE